MKSLSKRPIWTASTGVVLIHCARAEQVSKGLPMADVLALRRFALGSPESQCGRNAVRRQQCDLRLDADHRVGIQGEPIPLPNGR
jgi:hypothetical protein